MDEIKIKMVARLGLGGFPCFHVLHLDFMKRKIKEKESPLQLTRGAQLRKSYLFSVFINLVLIECFFFYVEEKIILHPHLRLKEYLST